MLDLRGMNTYRQRLIEKTYAIWGAILVVWALYRAFVSIPDWMSDLIVKPLVFFIPVIIYVYYRERRPLSSIGIAKGKLKRDLIFGLGFGLLIILVAIVSNMVKHQRIFVLPLFANSIYYLPAFLLAVVAAGAEEILVRGFFYTRLKEGYQSELKALVYSAVMYFLLLVPVIFTVTRLTGASLLLFVISNVVMSLANTMVFNETKTVVVPTLIHAFWNIAVSVYL